MPNAQKPMLNLSEAVHERDEESLQISMSNWPSTRSLSVFLFVCLSVRCPACLPVCCIMLHLCYRASHGGVAPTLFVVLLRGSFHVGVSGCRASLGGVALTLFITLHERVRSSWCLAWWGGARVPLFFLMLCRHRSLSLLLSSLCFVFCCNVVVIAPRMVEWRPQCLSF